MIRRLARLGLLLFAGRVAAAQTQTVRVDDAGPGIGPQVLVEALKHPYTIAPQGPGQYVVPRSTEVPTSLVVLGRDVVIEGGVRGDVIVIGADLYMHPGGAIEGRALSFGGGVYESSLAAIVGGTRVFQDFTYDIAAVDGGYSLRYRSLELPPETGWSLPGVYGVASPEYDRSSGLSIGLSPRYTFRAMPLVLQPKVTYRSQLGQVDPSLAFEYNFSRRARLTGRVERATLSNDRWIRTDMLNSVDFLWNGNDTRNYYRATYGEARLAKTWEFLRGDFTPYVGARAEDAKTVRPGVDATGGPWTFLSRDDEEREDRLRLNPAIDEGKIYSGLLGGTFSWTNNGFVLRARVNTEVGTFRPNGLSQCVAGLCRDEQRATFGQATAQAHVEFPTFAQQLLAMDGHFVVTTGGDRTPRQRYAYFGGSGTIPMLDLLSLGGDELVYIDGRYVIPLHWFNLPFFGPPTFTLRELLGGAAVGQFPDIHQAVGARLGLKMFYAEYLIDPDTHKSRGGVGISITP